jgi:hypothetical protein
VDSHALSTRSKLMLLPAAVGGFGALYGGIGVVTARSGGELYTLPTRVDGWVEPYWPAVLLYLFLFPQVIAGLVVIEDRRVVRRALLGFTVLVLSGVPFWVFYPVTVPRTPVPVEDLWTYGLALTRYIDPPVNCFPSMHVADAMYAALVIRRHDPRVGGALILTTLGIWWSTMALDQHWFVDGLAGIALAVAIEHVAMRGLPQRAFPTPSWRHHAVWLSLFVVLFLACAVPWWMGWLTAADLPQRW